VFYLSAQHEPKEPKMSTHAEVSEAARTMAFVQGREWTALTGSERIEYADQARAAMAEIAQLRRELDEIENTARTFTNQAEYSAKLDSIAALQRVLGSTY
jgi:hypothetical protein